MRKIKPFLFIGFFLGFYALNSQAMPVEDPVEWGKTWSVYLKISDEYEKLKAQYDLLKQTYDNAVDQLNTAKRIANDAEGNYGYGNLINSHAALIEREWSPDNWQDALKGLAGGNPERYQELIQQYQKDHPTLSPEEFKKGASLAQAQQYQQQIQTNQAASVTASYAFNDIKQHLENIHELSQYIEKSQNTKAAMDLNARLLTEIAYIQVQQLKMQSLVNQQLMQESADKIQAETQAAKFDQLPTK